MDTVACMQENTNHVSMKAVGVAPLAHFYRYIIR